MASKSDNVIPHSTVREQECTACGKQGTAKQCSRCQKALYCSQECQKADWVRHIIDCNAHTGRPVTSAHHLVRAIAGDIPLADLQARIDWGLEKALAVSPESCQMLLLLYAGLIKESNVTATQLNRWRVDGTLVSEINAAYEAMPPKARGERYSWFLSHKRIFEDPSVTFGEILDAEDERDVRLWAIAGPDLAGGSAISMRDFLQKLDMPGHECWAFLKCLMDWSYPGPSSLLWLQFGFCACPTREDEVKLTKAYQDLIARCSFTPFCDAYSNRSLVGLFQAHDISLFSPSSSPSIFYLNLIDVLSVPLEQLKSVWELKQLANMLSNTPTLDWQCSYPLNVQYGFLNCKNKKDARALMKLYQNFFSSPTSNPLDLDEACRAGRLADFFFKDLGIKMNRKQKKRYQWWLTNRPFQLAPLTGGAIDPRWQRLADSLSPGAPPGSTKLVIQGSVIVEVEDTQESLARRHTHLTREDISALEQCFHSAAHESSVVATL